MSNPLLQPDKRFRRESLADEQGRNRFAESDDVVEAATVSGGEILAAPSEPGPPAYQPHYTAALPHRGGFIAGLGATGFAVSWLLLLSFSPSWVVVGVAASFLGVALSIAAAIVGYHDLKGISLGAIDPAGRDKTLLGFRLALAGIFLGGGAALAVIWLAVRGIIDVAF